MALDNYKFDLKLFSGLLIGFALLLNLAMAAGFITFKLCKENCSYIGKRLVPIIFHNPKALITCIILATTGLILYRLHVKFSEL